VAATITAHGYGRSGGLIPSFGYGLAPIVRVPAVAIMLIGADPSVRILVGADPSIRTLVGADPSVRTLVGADPSAIVLEGADPSRITLEGE